MVFTDAALMTNLYIHVPGYAPLPATLPGPHPTLNEKHIIHIDSFNFNDFLCDNYEPASFRLIPENEGTKSNTGFWGLTVGLDYFYSKNQFISSGISGVSDFFVPFPTAVDISGEFEHLISIDFAWKIRL